MPNPTDTPLYNPASLLCEEISRGGFFPCLMVDGQGKERLGFEPTLPVAATGATADMLSKLGDDFRASENFRLNLSAYLRSIGAVYSMPLASGDIPPNEPNLKLVA